MSQTNECQCYYCGCKDHQYLVQCTKTKMFLCNGKANLDTSHIVHFLEKTGNNSVIFVSKSDLKVSCIKCSLTNVFKLGIISDENGGHTFCCSECHHTYYPDRDFHDLIHDGAFVVLREPKDNEYSKISINEAAKKVEKFKGKSSTSDKDKFKHAYQYNTVEKFRTAMSQFIKYESEYMENSCKKEYHTNDSYNVMQFIDRRKLRILFPDLARVVSQGSNLKVYFYGYERHLDARCTFKGSNNDLDVDFMEDPPGDRVDYIKVMPNTVIFKYQRDALNFFCETKPPRLNADLVQFIIGNFDPERNKLTEKKVKSRNTNMNKFQIDAIEYALSSRLSIIQGPPGTGKTQTVACLVNEIYLDNPEKRSLCVAQSNAAADNIAHRIFTEFKNIKVCRVYGDGSESKDSIANPVNSLDMADRDKEKEAKIISSCTVVVSTLAAAGNTKRFGKANFDFMIVDEAGQCIDVDLLIPLRYGIQQLVLVGDFQQLGPYISSKEAKSKKFDTSLMERLNNTGVPMRILGIQYRMHPAIAEFPNQEFYGGGLQNGVSATNRYMGNLNFLPNPNVPMFFWDVTKAAEEDYYKSYRNSEEASCVFILVESLYRAGVHSSGIGIITPYNAQQDYIRSNMKDKCKKVDDKSYFDGIEISSVDSFQGREKDFIILSNVRSNDKGESGFVKDAKRINVSLTRAKCGLFIIGHSKTLGKFEIWKRLIEHFIAKGLFYRFHDGKWKVSSFDPS